MLYGQLLNSMCSVDQVEVTYDPNAAYLSMIRMDMSAHNEIHADVDLSNRFLSHHITHNNRHQRTKNAVISQTCRYLSLILSHDEIQFEMYK